VKVGYQPPIRRFAILGDPVEHSLSPVMQNAALQHERLDGVYEATRCDAEAVQALMQSLCETGGGGNVTLPHKLRAADALDVPSEAVRSTGACNTFWGGVGGIHGDNTDVAGFAAACRMGIGPLNDLRVVVLGAGGAAAAVLSALLAENAAGIHLHNRTLRRAYELAERMQDARIRVAPDLEDLQTEEFDLLVNTTPLGLSSNDPPAVDPSAFASLGAVFDVVYHPTGVTPLVELAHSAGIPAVDGTEMLVQQGAAAFNRWWGRPAPVDVMRDALARHREDRS